MRPSGLDGLVRGGNCPVAVALTAFAAAASALGAGGLPCSYSVETFAYDCAWPFPDGAAAYGIAPNSGVVVGAWQDCATAEGSHAFYWPPGADGIEPIPYPPGVHHMKPYDVSDAGWMVGGMGPNSASEVNAFLHKDGVTTDLGELPGAWQTIAEAVASDGTIVGRWNNVQAFKWREGVMTDLAPALGTAQGIAYDISDDGRFITGWAGSTISLAHAFILNGDQVTFPPLPLGASKSEGRAITSQGNVCGRYVTPISSYAFAYLNERLVPLQAMRSTTSSQANDLNEHFVVGSATVSGLGQRGMVWTHDGQVHDVNDLLHVDAGVVLRVATAISQSGVITGYGTPQGTQGQTVAVRLTPVWPKMGDLNCDGIVNGFDLATLLGSWGTCRTESCQADLSKDGVINGIDLALLLSQWG